MKFCVMRDNNILRSFDFLVDAKQYEEIVCGLHAANPDDHAERIWIDVTDDDDPIVRRGS